MTIQHVAIDDPFIHEPKGASSASADTVYVADGSGSGSWQKIAEDQVNTDYTNAVKGEIADEILDGTIPLPPAEVFVSAVIADVSTAETLFIPIPENAEVVQMQTVLEGAITDANATVTLANAASATIAQATIAFSGSGAGDSEVAPAAANEELTGPTYLRLSTDGGSTGAQRLFVTVHLKVTRTI